MGGWALPSKLTLLVIHPPPCLVYCLVFRADYRAIYMLYGIVQ